VNRTQPHYKDEAKVKGESDMNAEDALIDNYGNRIVPGVVCFHAASRSINRVVVTAVEKKQRLDWSGKPIDRATGEPVLDWVIKGKTPAEKVKYHWPRERGEKLHREVVQRYWKSTYYTKLDALAVASGLTEQDVSEELKEPNPTTANLKD
jgi:hypothetical protein